MELNYKNLSSTNGKLTRNSKNFQEEKTMFEEANKNLLVRTKEIEVELQILRSQIAASTPQQQQEILFSTTQKAARLDSVLESQKIDNTRFTSQLETLKINQKQLKLNISEEIRKRKNVTFMLISLCEACSFKDIQSVRDYVEQLDYSDEKVLQFDHIVSAIQSYDVGRIAILTR